MAKSITKNLGGRPTKLDDDVVQKLDSIFKVGGTIEEAVTYAGIAKRTYHYWVESDEDFARKMEAAKHYADVVAKNVVVDAIVKDKDLGTAKWWLEKRQFKNDVQVNINEQKILVIPSEILDKYKIAHEELDDNPAPDSKDSSNRHPRL